MSNKTILSIVILHYNRPRDLYFSLNKTIFYLKKTGLYTKSEIIIVDNNSTHLPAIPRYKIKLIKLNKNIGVSAINYGFNIAKGRYVLQLDDDSFPLHGIDKAISYLDSNKKVGICALNITGGPFTMSRLKLFQKLNYFVGCGALIRKDVLVKTKGYSPWIFLYSNEFDLSLHAHKYRYETIFYGSAKVKHLASKVNRSTVRYEVYSLKNELLVNYCYYSNLIMLLRFLLIFFFHIKYVIQKKEYYSIIYKLKAVVNAYVESSSIKRNVLPFKLQLSLFYNDLKK